MDFTSPGAAAPGSLRNLSCQARKHDTYLWAPRNARQTNEAGHAFRQFAERLARPTIAFRRRGGASYLTRTLGPSHYTGLDLNPEGIAFCQSRHRMPGLDFVRGDAGQFPFPDGSIDAVINVEASHCYESLPRFFHEVARGLKPGGDLCVYCALERGDVSYRSYHLQKPG